MKKKINGMLIINAPAISPDKVKKGRAAVERKTDFYFPIQLLKEHPVEK